jgi:hypothetical protein
MRRSGRRRAHLDEVDLVAPLRKAERALAACQAGTDDFDSCHLDGFQFAATPPS